LLGALLGDGKLSGTSVMFPTGDPEMLAGVHVHAGDELALRAAGGPDWRIVQAAGAHRRGVSANPIMEALRGLGLWSLCSEAKFIPRMYLDASRDTRLDLLRGLMDTDGWVERWGSARFCSTSERLALDVAELVRSLGGWCSVRRRTTTFRDSEGVRKDGRPAFVCNIQHGAPKTIVSLSAK